MFLASVKGNVLVLVVSLLLCAFSTQAYAQLAFSGDDPNINRTSYRIALSAKAAYQHIGINFSMPASLIPGSLLVGIPISPDSSVDFKVRNANVLLGGVQLDLLTMRRWSLFVSGEGSLNRNVSAVTEANPLFGNLGVYRPIEWSGSDLQYWELEAGGGLLVSNDLKAVAGVRRDKLTVRLNTPGGDYSALAPPPVSPVTQLLSLGGFGDFQENLWIPYLGIELTGPNYKWNLIGSPFVATEVKLPLSALTYFRSGAIFGGLFNGYEQNRQVTYNYKLTQPSVFLETNFEYALNPLPAFALTGWFRGSWMHFHGNGSLVASTYVADDYLHPGGIPVPFVGVRTQSASPSDTGTADLGRYFMSAGVSARLTF